MMLRMQMMHLAEVIQFVHFVSRGHCFFSSSACRVRLHFGLWFTSMALTMKSVCVCGLDERAYCSIRVHPCGNAFVLEQLKKGLVLSRGCGHLCCARSLTHGLKSLLVPGGGVCMLVHQSSLWTGKWTTEKQ